MNEKPVPCSSEGVDTKITVAYNEQAGPAGARFLKEGDHVAVIAPSTLRTGATPYTLGWN